VRVFQTRVFLVVGQAIPWLAYLREFCFIASESFGNVMRFQFSADGAVVRRGRISGAAQSAI
jgi:hypothetical protein